MKIIKKYTFLAVAITGTLAMGSCKKGFLDINDNPNAPTTLNIVAGPIFTQTEHAVGARVGGGTFTFLDNWVGYSGASGSYAIDQTETSYRIDQSFSEGVWDNHYNVLFDLNQVQQLSRGKDSMLLGASMILSSKLWGELVDLFGNIPYSQAFQGNANRSPAYDNGATIYQDLQKKLDSGIYYMTTSQSPTNSKNFQSSDIIFGSTRGITSSATQVDRWVRFANTLKLRLLLHQANNPNFATPTAEIAKIKDPNNAGQFYILRSGQSATVNPGYANDVNKQQPFYAAFGLTPTGADANPITRANNYFINKLGTAAQDPRLARIYAGTTGVTYGLQQGNPTGASKVGPGLLVGPTSPQWIMTSVESLFLEAEAIQRGWIVGNAQTAYNNAVTESFLFLGLTSAQAATYLASNPLATWPSTPAAQLNRILLQKYIGMAFLDPQETYTDFRRFTDPATGIVSFLPDNGFISVNTNRVRAQLPNRLLYPQSEFTANAANAVAQGVTDAYASKIFWQP